MKTFDQIFVLAKLQEDTLDLPQIVSQYDEAAAEAENPQQAKALMDKIRPYKAIMNRSKARQVITTPDASADWPKDENVGPPQGFTSYGRWQVNPDGSLVTTGGARGDKNGGHVGHPKIAGYWGKDTKGNIIVRGRMGSADEVLFLNGKKDASGKVIVPGHLRDIIQQINAKIA